MSFGMKIMKSTARYSNEQTVSEKIELLKEKIGNADAILIGAGAGLSASVGFTYSGERFQEYFSDFIQKYHFRNMYEGGFYPFESLEEYWAYWSRYIFINRYIDAPKPVYENAFELVKDKDYFVLTTNVDHQFQKAGFAKERLFYTQGDYGLFQCSRPCHRETYENKDIICKMLQAQGYFIDEDGSLSVPDGVTLKMAIPSELIPYCPKCGKPQTMNLRSDNTFVEDEGWHFAAERYDNFLRTRRNQWILYLELGVGYNTPGIIKYPFWQMTAKNRKAVYSCVNFGEVECPKEIEKQSICIDSDIGEVLTGMDWGKCESELTGI